MDDLTLATTLLAAAKLGDAARVLALMPQAHAPLCWRALRQAMAHSHIGLIQQMVLWFPDSLCEGHPSLSESCLRWAIRRGHLEALRESMALPLPPSVWTVALEYAAYHGHLDAVNLLVSHLDVTAHHKPIFAAMEWAVQQGHWPVVMALSVSVSLVAGHATRWGPGLLGAINAGERELLVHLLGYIEPTQDRDGSIERLYIDIFRQAVKTGQTGLIPVIFSSMWQDRKNRHFLAWQTVQEPFEEKDTQAVVAMLGMLPRDALLRKVTIQHWARGACEEQLHALLTVVNNPASALDALWMGCWQKREVAVRVAMTHCDAASHHHFAMKIAIERGSEESVELLFPTVVDPDDHEALFAWSMEHDNQCAALLFLPLARRAREDRNTLIVAIQKGMDRLVKELLRCSEQPAASNDLLQLAVRHGQYDIVEMLLPISDPKAEDNLVFRLAAHSGNRHMVDLLLPHCDPCACDNDAIRGALRNGHFHVVQTLWPVTKLTLDDLDGLVSPGWPCLTPGRLHGTTLRYLGANSDSWPFMVKIVQHLGVRETLQAWKRDDYLGIDAAVPHLLSLLDQAHWADVAELAIYGGVRLPETLVHWLQAEEERSELDSLLPARQDDNRDGQVQTARGGGRKRL